MLNSTTVVLLQVLVWHEITHESLYAIKHRNQKKDRKYRSFSPFLFRCSLCVLLRALVKIPPERVTIKRHLNYNEIKIIIEIKKIKKSWIHFKYWESITWWQSYKNPIVVKFTSSSSSSSSFRAASIDSLDSISPFVTVIRQVFQTTSCPHRAVVDKFLLVVQHLDVCVKVSIGERRLWVRPY